VLAAAGMEWGSGEEDVPAAAGEVDSLATAKKCRSDAANPLEDDVGQGAADSAAELSFTSLPDLVLHHIISYLLPLPLHLTRTECDGHNLGWWRGGRDGQGSGVAGGRGPAAGQPRVPRPRAEGPPAVAVRAYSSGTAHIDSAASRLCDFALPRYIHSHSLQLMPVCGAALEALRL
jgi:hypothetical protein